MPPKNFPERLNRRRIGALTRLDWRDVDFDIDTIQAGVRAGAQRTKTRKGRPAPMPHVRMMLWGMWQAAGKPSSGPVS